MFGMESLFGSAVEGAFGLWNNQVNSEEADAARDASAWQAHLNRDWQERMSGSAYQRATQDMKSAGLNPMLAYQQGGASTPSGAQGHAPVAAPASARISMNATTAAQIRNLDAQTDLTKAQTQEIAPTAAVGRERTAHESANIRQQIAESAMRIENVIAETSKHDASAGQIRQEEQNLKALLPHIEESIRLLRAQTTQTGTLTNEAKQRIRENLPALQAGLQRLETIYKQMESPGRETAHAFDSSATGAVLRTIREALKDILPGFGFIVGPRGPTPSKGSTTSTSHHDSRGNSSTTHSRTTKD